MYLRIYLTCPNCTAMENHEYQDGLIQLTCSFCLKPFSARMRAVKVFDAGKTQIDLTAEVIPFFQTQKAA